MCSRTLYQKRFELMSNWTAWGSLSFSVFSSFHEIIYQENFEEQKSQLSLNCLSLFRIPIFYYFELRRRIVFSLKTLTINRKCSLENHKILLSSLGNYLIFEAFLLDRRKFDFYWLMSVYFLFFFCNIH